MTRRFQFSLRWLFGLFVGVPCGIVSYFRHQLSDYQLAAEPIEKASGCRIVASGDGMGMFGGRYGINKLDFTDAPVDDAVLRGLEPHLEQLPNLKWFNLKGTRITDDGLETLSQLKQLRSLIVTDTGVTAKGVERARKELPGCEIYGP
jgi:hypothetical protein